MTDILPKNPYLKYDMYYSIWQQSQDDTMKALRPILELCYMFISDSELQETKEKLEQILEES